MSTTLIIPTTYNLYIQVFQLYMIREHPDIPAIIDYTDEDDASKTECNKDTGTRKKLQKWTRGHLFIVRGGGHIDSWQPLYQ